jgi:hypothetical protein
MSVPSLTTSDNQAIVSLAHFSYSNAIDIADLFRSNLTTFLLVLEAGNVLEGSGTQLAP